MGDEVVNPVAKSCRVRPSVLRRSLNRSWMLAQVSAVVVFIFGMMGGVLALPTPLLALASASASVPTGTAAPELVLASSATPAPTSGTVLGKVTDDGGQALPAQVRFISPESGQLITAYSGWLGAYSVNLRPGRYTVEVSHGPEYSLATRSVEVTAGQTTRVDAVLSRLYALDALGWLGGDTHLHSTYSDGRQVVEDVALAAVANGLDWAVLTDHNTIAGHPEWLAARRFAIGPLSSSAVTTATVATTATSTASAESSTLAGATARTFLAIPGEEVTTSLGHFNAIGIRSLVNWQPATAAADLSRIASDTIRQGGLIDINHPFASGNMAFRNWQIVDSFPALEVWNGGAPPALPVMGNAESLNQWMKLLNEGRRIAAVAASDCHDVTGGPYAALAYAPIEQAAAALGEAAADPAMVQFLRANESKLRAWVKAGLYPGTPRTYVHVARLSEFNVLQALARGNSFMTNGPLVLADLAGKIPGETVSWAGKPADQLMLNIKVLFNRPILQVQVVQGGKTVAQLDAAGQNEFIGQVAINPQAGNWVVVLASGSYPYMAVTNPIYLTSDPQIEAAVQISGPNAQLIWSGPVQLVGRQPTALDALTTAGRQAGVSWHEAGGFVDEIAGYPMTKSAGWMYKVNGTMPSVGAADYRLKPGDRVEWYWSQWGN